MNKKIVSAVLSAAMCISMLSGCGGEPNQPTADNKETTNAAEDANKKTDVTVGVGQQFTTLDPGISTETVNSYAIKHMYAALYSKLEDGTIIPDLADGEPEVSEDGLTYTIKIKENVQWSDGKPITAQDFVYGINRNLTYGAENSFAIDSVARYLQDAQEYQADTEIDLSSFEFAGVKAIDDKTVQYQLKSPCAFFTGLLCGDAWLPLREDFAEPGFSEWSVEPGYPVCGPYELTYCNENEKVVLEKNENYYNADKVTIDKITFLVMPDMDAQAAAFKTGDLDVALSINSSIISTYENKNELWSYPEQAVYSIDVNSGEKGIDALKNVDVRRAISLAIDREEICKAIDVGDFYKPLYGYVPYGMKGAEKDFRIEGDEKEKMAGYDPQAAKELLEKAGYDENNPLELKYKYSNNSIHGDIAQILQQMWKNVGIDVELEVVESGVFYDQVDQGDFDLARYALSCSNDPSQYLNQWTKEMQPVPAVNDPKYDQMMQDVAFITDRTEYMNKLHEIEEYLVKDMVYVIPLFGYNQPALKKENLKGVHESHDSLPLYSYAYAWFE